MTKVKVTIATEDGEVLDQFEVLSARNKITPETLSKEVRYVIEEVLDTQDAG